MSIWKKILQALAGLALACAAALGMGTWIFPEERDLILPLGAFRLSATGIGAGLSLLVMLAFADAWVGIRNRKDPAGAGPGRTLNGLGAGFPAAVLIWKIFEQRTALGRGTAPADGMEIPGWLAADGRWATGRIEIMLAVLVILSVTLWLVLRRQDLPENGDLAWVGLSCWCAGRMVTEHLRAEQIALLGSVRIVGWLAMGCMAVILACWTARIVHQKRNTGYAYACVPVFAASAAGLALIGNQVIRIGIPAADLGMQVCLALLALKAVLCAGRVSR